MCGIVAIVSKERETIESSLRRMTVAQAHRGPDDSGEGQFPFGDGILGLGHRRLSIIDPSPAGHQPMCDPRSGNVLVYNGEIYNFGILRRELEDAGDTFRGHSDTEVLLHALTRWGPACLTRLQGMYAFAFYDAVAHRLILARDPAGIKPLYLAHVGDTWLFASEVRALLASGLVHPKIDPRGVAGLLAYGAVQGPCTLFRDIQSLSPGSWLEITVRPGGAWKVEPPRTFWHYPRPNLRFSEEETVSRVAAALDEAVRDHLVSDVPVGIFLSSGLDSTVVAGLAARHTPNLRSFTVAFSDHPDFSEEQLAAETAREFGLNHTNISISSQEAEATAADWLSRLDQPSMDGLNVFIISRAVRAQGIKVALSGQGGDELFGGYPSFREVPRIRSLIASLQFVPSVVRRRVAGLAGAFHSVAHRDKLADMCGSDGNLVSLALQRRRALSNRQMASLGFEAAALELSPDFLPQEALDGVDVEDDDVAVISRLESQFYQGNMLLRDADSNGMAHGLEIRVPLLDQRLIELVHALPGSRRLPPGESGKYLLRRACPNLLRADLLRQPKRGFTLPIRRWMLGSLRPFCESGLATLKETGLLRSRGIDAIWQGFLAEPESPLWTRALTLSVLGIFLRTVGACL
jgi:asparagine synthase (glutamine-hydrolysing)